jgi:hypothetical protein
MSNRDMATLLNISITNCEKKPLPLEKQLGFDDG